MKYFTIDEMCRSAVADRKGIDNTPTKEAKRNMVRLIETVLDPARKLLKAPVIINSGYRSPALNRAVGGAKRSYHLQGRAADLNTGSKAGNRRLYVILQTLPHSELINEHDYTWIHVAL